MAVYICVVLNTIAMVNRSVRSTFTQEKTLNEQTIIESQTNVPTTPEDRQPKRRRRSPQKGIRTLSLTEVDVALATCDKTIRLNTELVKTKLVSGVPIPSGALRELSIANRQKVNLTMRRIALLIERGDEVALELVDKLCKHSVEKKSP